MGFDSGGFWKWYRRNNDTRPFVMPLPGCNATHETIEHCTNWTSDGIQLSENLCQGEDDLGLVCWGPPSFHGWHFHWKGIEFQDAPWLYVPVDGIATKKESRSRLEYVNIWYAGYDKELQNTTAAILARGMPPFMNYVDIKYSARDGIRVIAPDGPVEITNSTIAHNRGHGVVVENTTDGRLFINETRIMFNYGNGIYFRPKLGLSYRPVIDEPLGRESVVYYEPETPEMDICRQHEFNSKRKWFPRIYAAHLKNSTTLVSETNNWPCYVSLDFGRRLPITYSIQFLEMTGLSLLNNDAQLFLYVCDSTRGQDLCKFPRYKIPVFNGYMPPTVEAQNTGGSLWIGLRSEGSNITLNETVNVVMKIHANFGDQVFYGLNVSNSRITDNFGTGVYVENMRDRTVINNVTILRNQHVAGLHVCEGVGDIWVNNSLILDNWGDGINITYTGGSTVINGTQLSRNRMRGFALHQSLRGKFLALKQEVVFKGRPATNTDYTPTKVEENWWGGILVGNFCTSDSNYWLGDPKVIISYVEMVGNRYHPSFEYHSCQREKQPITEVEISGSVCRLATGFCVRVQPAVNLRMDINDNRFIRNERAVLLIRNRDHPQLFHLPARVSITRNQMKYNRGYFIVSVGLNDRSPVQNLTFHMQNEIKENEVINPFPLLNTRTLPHAAMIVSSSNVMLRRNCFHNPKAEFEIATDLDDHSRVIDARENNWGHTQPASFMYKIFDQFKRYTLARFDINPYAAVCNSQNPKMTELMNFFRQFRTASHPYVIGGTIYENTDLSKGVYTVVDDLHISPGAVLTLQPGTVLQFADGIGMLVQGELLRADYQGSSEPILFTLDKRDPISVPNIRLVQDDSERSTLAPASGRLEVFVDGEWGTVCNRSWTVELAAVACNQLGMVLDPEFLENWVVYPPPGNLPIIFDNIRCEELEYDITKCRHDGRNESVHLSCKPTDIVGLRCVEPKWAGVRYSLLANPAMVTGQTTIRHLIIEKAGLLDFRQPTFTAAFQIDWNYHLFEYLTVRDNFWTGVDILYNDPVKKPKLAHCTFVRNRRHGLRLRSAGITLENVTLIDNENAGLRFNPLLTRKTQRDVYSWLRRSDAAYQDTTIVDIPSRTVTEIQLSPSSREQRRFIVSKASACDGSFAQDCAYDLTIRTSLNFGRIGIQLVNRPSNSSDENVLIYDHGQIARTISLRDNFIEFPFVTSGGVVKLHYSRSYGPARIALLVFHLNNFEYLDPFLHMRACTIENNQYGVSAIHYSSFYRVDDGSILLRNRRTQLWFHKSNFTRNSQAVIWVNGPLLFDASQSSPVAVIEYFIDNCSVALNNGSIIETHRDLHRSANAFKWKVWQSTMLDNRDSGMSIALPDPHYLDPNFEHRFELRETRFQDNENFHLELSGYLAWVNISSNNFTRNRARDGHGLIKLTGMEKELIMERNRWRYNRCRWVVSYDIKSHALFKTKVAARVFYNYFFDNYFLSPEDEYAENWPRSFAFGLFGLQQVDLHYNNFRNHLLDFEAVAGLKGAMLKTRANFSHNYWGRDSRAAIVQRIFDFDDWNIFSLAEYNPYFVTEERSLNWEWRPADAQLGTLDYEQPSVYDLHGRLFKSLTMKRQREKWTIFPYWYKPDKPYYIRKDLTIMPGATLTIEPGVEVHIYPNVRILVLGTLIAQGTFWDPIRLKPINLTDIQRPKQPTSATRWRRDAIYRMFPLLKRYDSFYQKFDVHLTDSLDPSLGFLEIKNMTTGELVPVCDRQFTRRNAEVVCRELGMETRNVHVRIGPRWNYNPKLKIVKSYPEPRQCYGHEGRLSDCALRLSSDETLWRCVDSEHFVFIHCGKSVALDSNYVGHWGGLMFGYQSAETHAAVGTNGGSVLRHVEIVGAGQAHNDSSAAVTVVRRGVVMDHVNVTNCSMHGIDVVAPREQVIFVKMNVTDNFGVGLRLLGVNSLAGSSIPPLFGEVPFPYHMFGILEFCSVDKRILVEQRMFVYFKYDSYPVDCLKTFVSVNSAKQLEFKLLVANLYNVVDNAVRPDRITLYDGHHVDNGKILGIYGSSKLMLGQHAIRSETSELTVHLKANAADGTYGFLAEVVTVPAPPEPSPLRQITLREVRFERNDRGAVRYACTGDINPDVEVDFCSFNFNGYHLWGNFTTNDGALKMALYNTQNLRLENSMFFRNPGAVHITASSSSPSARLVGLVRNCAFGNNYNSESLVLDGWDYQKFYVVNNFFGRNWAPYHDTVYVGQVWANFTHNTFYNNTGTHIVHLGGYRDVSTEFQIFYKNVLYDNIATGHGYHYPASYGYFGHKQPAYVSSQLRKRRDVSQIYRTGSSSTSFEWWANVGDQAERYHSTVFAASAQEKFELNLFNNPNNDFELTTAAKNPTDAYTGPLDARGNHWGSTGTAAVASGKIRDGNDYDYLIPVDHLPVIESNTSLIDGFCPPGWFQAGYEEWKSFQSCFLFVPGAVSYSVAQQFCKDQGAYMPFFRDQDRRLAPLASKVDEMNREFAIPFERFIPHMQTYETRFWISSIVVPPEKCGYLSSSTGGIGIYNCEDVLPFVCEKGPKPYEEPLYWQPAGIVAIIIAVLLVLLVTVLGLLWWLKSKRRKEEFFERKSSLRASIRSFKLAQAKLRQEQSIVEVEREKARPPSPDLIEIAHRNLVLGSKSLESLNNSRIVVTTTTTTSPYTVSKLLSNSSLMKLNNNESSYDSYTSSTIYQNGTFTTKGSCLRTSPSSSYCESAYRSDFSHSSETSSLTGGTPSFKSFRSKAAAAPPPPRPALPVRSAPLPNLTTKRDNLVRRNDTSVSNATTTTESCATCQTGTTTLSYDTNCSVCREKLDENRSSTYFSSTCTDSNATLTVRDSASTCPPESTITQSSSTSTSDECSSTVRSPVRCRRAVGQCSRDTLQSENLKLYCEQPLSSDVYSDVPSIYGCRRSRAPICFKDRSAPDLTYTSTFGASASRPDAVDSVYQSELAPMASNPSSRSLSQLYSPWTPPDLDTFSRSSQCSSADEKPKPLETAIVIAADVILSAERTQFVPFKSWKQFLVQSKKAVELLRRIIRLLFMLPFNFITLVNIILKMRSDQGHQENGKFHDSTFVSYFITNMRAVRVLCSYSVALFNAMSAHVTWSTIILLFYAIYDYANVQHFIFTSINMVPKQVSAHYNNRSGSDRVPLQSQCGFVQQEAIIVHLASVLSKCGITDRVDIYYFHAQMSDS
ncbi:putative scavenger receptor cysteine-rich domain protein [Trichinella spiralis]|uniref:putative scavenger receptor cysteine-rich domain protein n=1 Tax=Trichinella spiralis TaxID=6334 RepID=UPI0001EFC0E8|nr:putative scavenger receptor cysteine-rich domain protein [Trichinella spiralis]